MALVDRFRRPGMGEDIVNALPTHSFAAAVSLAAGGHVTKQNVIDTFSLSAGDEVQLDEIIANYVAKPDDGSADGKLAYINTIENAMILHEAGIATTAKVKTILGLT